MPSPRKNAPEAKTFHKQALGDSGGLAGGEGRPDTGNKRRRRFIRLTPCRLVVVWSGRSLAMVRGRVGRCGLNIGEEQGNLEQL
jgi:hypothetical protein